MTSASRTSAALCLLAATLVSLTGCSDDPPTQPEEPEPTESSATAQTDEPAAAPAPPVEETTSPPVPTDPYLASNAEREGVVTTASGLQYEIIETGDGASPGPTDMVTTHYHGTFVDGRHIRQFLRARRARLVSRQRRHQVLDRSAAVDAGRGQMEALLCIGAGLRLRRPQRHPAQLDACLLKSNCLR